MDRVQRWYKEEKEKRNILKEEEREMSYKSKDAASTALSPLRHRSIVLQKHTMHAQR